MSDNYSTELADAIQRTAYRGHRIGIVIVIVFLLSGVIFFIDSSHNISILYESAFILALPFAFLYLVTFHFLVTHIMAVSLSFNSCVLFLFIAPL
jgi:hypothetical protein